MALKKELVFEGLRKMFLSDEELNILTSPRIGSFHLSRDLGVKTASLEFGRTGVWSGNYRLLELFKGDRSLNFVMFNVWKSNEFVHRPIHMSPSKRKRREAATGKEGIKPVYTLIVGRGNATVQYLSLKLDFEKYIVGRPNKKVRIFHDGEPNPLKTCPKRRLDALKSIRKKAPPLFSPNVDEYACLGRITERKKYSINDEDVSDMLLRLAIYAGYLDKFKSKFRKRTDKRIFV